MVIGWLRTYWRQPKLWMGMACLLGVHFLIFVPVLRTYPEWRIFWFWPVVTVEAGLSGTVMETLLGRKPGKRHGSK